MQYKFHIQDRSSTWDYKGHLLKSPNLPKAKFQIYQQLHLALCVSMCIFHVFNNCYCRKLFISLWKIICILHCVHRLAKSFSLGRRLLPVKALKTQILRLKMCTLMRELLETAAQDGKVHCVDSAIFFSCFHP